MFSYKVNSLSSIVFFSTLTYTVSKNTLNFPVHIKIFKELITIDIEIKDRNRLKEFFQNFHNKAEDILFAIISKLPEKFIPSLIMNWLSRYLDKRISELKQESIKQTWKNMYLQAAVDEIHTRQQDTKEASTDELII